MFDDCLADWRCAQVTTPQPNIPDDLPTTHALLAEAHDAAETFYERFRVRAWV